MSPISLFSSLPFYAVINQGLNSQSGFFFPQKGVYTPRPDATRINNKQQRKETVQLRGGQGRLDASGLLIG